MLSREGARGRAALADLLFGDAARQGAAAATLGAANGWDNVVALGARWRVAPLLQRRLERTGGLPAPIPLRLRQLGMAASAHSTLTLHRAMRAAATLEEAGIHALAFKGVAAIAQLYGSPAARLAGDFDCFVGEEDARAAEEVLLANGFVSEDVPFEAHLRQIDLSPRLYNYARTYSSDGFQVDLHWKLGRKPPLPLRAATLMARGSWVTVAGGRLRVPHPVDAQLLTVHHAMRDGFLPSATLKDVGDLCAWWTLRAGAWDLDELIAAAIASGLGGSLLALWTIVAERDASHPAAAGAQHLERCLPAGERRAGRRLWRFFEAQLVHGDHAARTIELFALPQLLASGFADVRRRVRVAGAAGAHGERGPARQSFPTRAAGFARRSWRVARDLANVRQLSAYAAIARAQRRYR